MPHNISLTNAAAMTRRYRQNSEAILAAGFQNHNILPLCETFDRAAIDALLAQPGCTGLRIYYGMDTELKVHAILVGSDASNTDILPPNSIVKTEEDGYIMEQSIRCPPTCPPESPLNV
ncbi:hypothetical protein [Niabella drilacis]|uniref:Uncharacterized protein n=1 Tax=Niabella drilacis (strain DSM 25811 / CCM 8410 / CCUG 62505 / LMG 26954 / E90) TaxID=1285928 RepID=A0A1G6PGJ7_NIADE|nr:hypothetical protein [Niabella drilacis]SDC79283.1 hypothetical protein SAMN04487894_10431 [Niabella drilacis]